jgi:hypothetical protein
VGVTTRPVDYNLLVKCPVCGVDIGQDCVSAVTGKPRVPHQRRRFLGTAKRKVLEKGEQWDD